MDFMPVFFSRAYFFLMILLSLFSARAPAESINVQLLQSVQCTTEDNCWTLNQAGAFFHWDGSQWAPFSIGQGNFRLKDVFCPERNVCWGVGSSGKFFQWDGKSWAEWADLGSGNINAIFCSSSSDCWAAGNSARIYHYTKNWVQTTDFGAQDLNDITCLSNINCWAVGGNQNNPLILHWDGQTWYKSN